MMCGTEYHFLKSAVPAPGCTIIRMAGMFLDVSRTGGVLTRDLIWFSFTLTRDSAGSQVRTRDHRSLVQYHTQRAPNNKNS